MNKSSLFLMLSLTALFNHAHVRANEAAFVEFETPPEANHALSDRLSWGTQIISSAEFINDLDLDHSDDDHLMHLEPEMSLVFSYQWPPYLKAYAEYQFDARYFISQGSDNEEDEKQHLKVEQFYLQQPMLTEHMGYTLGRQEFKDDRSWWFDENMDAIKLNWHWDDFFIESSIARDKYFDEDLLEEHSDKPIDYFILQSGFYHDKRDQSSLFLILKSDKRPGRNDDPVFLGWQRLGEVKSAVDVRYWINAAVVFGEYRNRDLRGYGVDTGASLRFDLPGRPFLTLAFAYGSGDDTTSDGEDSNFRQSGLQDNESRTYGVSSYNYYGEVVDMELSNMRIDTIGLGLKPASDTSIELLYHRYQQIEADDDLFDSDLEQDPSGDFTDLGSELDLVVSHRLDKAIKLSLTLGRFDPGAAYDRRDTTKLFKFKLSWRY